MKRNTFFFAFVLGTLMIISCSESKKSTSSDEQSAPAMEAPAAEASPKKAVDPVGRVTGQFNELGIELTEDQQAQLNALSAKYDFNGAADREARQKMRTEFQNEMYNILTPEQQELYNQKRKDRKSK
ncbi:MAG TPA: hypothetical protein P5563_08320 [Saprospiraceae bacterium]|nr:hypothetical protein [Saprospiraceae bacterium]HRW75895.1 hypothetical protein [Saprospiraceae bacterium]